MRELKLMKGNEAIAEAAIRAGVDGYFGYPITPQSEIMEYLMVQDTMKRTGMVTLQAESEIAAINMVFGAAATGKMVMTSSSSPGISLMQETISYAASAEVPCLIVNVERAGPGLGTIQPSQADYFQAVKGGGHGDYKLIVLAPSSVQEMADFVPLAFELAFKYRNPAMILTDGAIGQMMEKVELFEAVPRKKEVPDWALTGKPSTRKANIVTSLDLDSSKMEKRNERLQAKYRVIEENEVRYEMLQCDDAEYAFVAYGSSARICQKAVEIARKNGIKVGLFRPISLFPFPSMELEKLSKQLKGILSVELSAGQMIEDIRLSVHDNIPVKLVNRLGGMVYSPTEVFDALKNNFFKG
jgi:2-oxoglutarate/2-oxoacid ferredoxin oxidoreductase subunit alpha